MMYFAGSVKVSSRRKDKFIVGERTHTHIHFISLLPPRSLSHRGVYPFPLGPTSYPPQNEIHSTSTPPTWVRQHFAIIFAIRMCSNLLLFQLNASVSEKLYFPKGCIIYKQPN